MQEFCSNCLKVFTKIVPLPKQYTADGMCQIFLSLLILQFGKKAMPVVLQLAIHLNKLTL